jgi:D-alanine-D-alanine ligase-like ATP-grasp enzyme
MAEKIPQDISAIAWNSHLGATFNDLEEGQYPECIIGEALNAISVIGQYFSGVDVMIYRSLPYILEVNTAIALSNPHRVEMFADAFKNMIVNHRR